MACSCAFAWPAAAAGVPAWTTYHHDAARSGIDPDSGSPLSPSQLWRTPALDGQVWAEPLVYGSRVYVVTENDSVYALDAATGAVLWQRSAGTPVPSGRLLCGDISPAVGITSTPVIDPGTNRIYVVATNWDGVSVSHHLVSFDLTSGASSAARAVDPPIGNPRDLLQRGSLALDGSEIVIPYGGNDGDCGSYHGWLVGAPENGSGPLLSYEAASAAGDLRGAIWGAGNAPVIDGSGSIYVATGNGNSSVSGDQESVVKLGPALDVTASWRPSNWSALDSSDKDLGSSEPLLLPGGYLFQTGKDSNGYLLQPGVSGLGVPVQTLQVCGGAEAKGGGVYASGIIYVACDTGLRAVSFDPLTGTVSLDSSWQVTAAANGPPIIAGGLVWVEGYGDGTLYGLDPQTGAIRYSQDLGSINHFATPSAAAGRLFAAGGDRVTGLRIAASPSPTATVTAIAGSPNPVAPGQAVTFTATVSPVPDGGSVGFSHGGGILGCAAVPIDTATGRASCRTSFPLAGPATVRATYSGNADFAGSASSALAESVNAPRRPAPALSKLRLSRLVFTGSAGTTLTLTVSARATVTAVTTQRRPGRRVGHRCRTRAKHGPRCTLTVQMASARFSAAGGVDHHRLRFPHLQPGNYLLAVTARDSGGRSKTFSLRFRIVRG